MKLRMVAGPLAATVFAAGLGMIAALAQTPAGIAEGESKPGQTGIANGVQYTIENVERAAPFGDINVDDAGTTPETVFNYVPSLPLSQFHELQARCFVIRSSPGRYPPVAVDLCQNMAAANIAGL